MSTDTPQPPRAVQPQPAREVVAGQRLYIDLTEHIEDPNGEPLTFKLRNSLTPDIATATLAGSTLTVTGVAPGAATFRIGATDDVDPGPRINEFILELRVTVTPVPLLPPRAVHPQPAREVVAGQRLYIDLTEHIEDPNGEPLTFKLRNSLTPEIATATLAGNILTVTGVAPGEATFRIGATDDVDPGPRINEFILELRVTVTPVPLLPPRAVHPQPAREVVAGQTLAIDLTEHIEDPNGEPLTFLLRNSLTPDIATATLAGNILTVTGVAPGEAIFRIGATDDANPGPRINEFILELRVTVTDETPPPPPPPPAPGGPLCARHGNHYTDRH